MNHSTYESNPLPRHRALFLSIAIAFALSLVTVSTAQAQVLPPHARPHGRSYSEWSAAYWQWLFGLPVDGHPGTDTPDFDVTDGQSGRVWFLTGPFGTVERNITIPAGTSLFVALINVDSSTLEEPPFYGATAADQLAIANGFAGYFTDLSFSLDGKSISNMSDFRVTSPQFPFTAPSPWIFGATGGTGTATGVGYFVMVGSSRVDLQACKLEYSIVSPK